MIAENFGYNDMKTNDIWWQENSREPVVYNNMNHFELIVDTKKMVCV